MELWFAVRQSTLSGARLKEAWRSAVISAAYTGITHSRADERCNTDKQTAKHYIRVENFVNVPDLNLKKIGFQSHH